MRDNAKTDIGENSCADIVLPEGGKCILPVPDEVRILYTNWKGERAWRRIIPLAIWKGDTQWHPEVQVLLKAFDIDKGAERDFACRDIECWYNPNKESLKSLINKGKKEPLTGLFRDNPKTPEGKYLVKRRDGTVPPWPSFVLGGADPHAEKALRAYADSCAEDPAIHPDFVAAVRRWADEYRAWRQAHGEGDPGMGVHRKDDPDTIAEMRRGFSA